MARSLKDIIAATKRKRKASKRRSSSPIWGAPPESSVWGVADYSGEPYGDLEDDEDTEEVPRPRPYRMQDEGTLFTMDPGLYGGWGAKPNAGRPRRAAVANGYIKLSKKALESKAKKGDVAAQRELHRRKVNRARRRKS